MQAHLPTSRQPGEILETPKVVESVLLCVKEGVETGLAAERAKDISAERCVYVDYDELIVHPQREAHAVFRIPQLPHKAIWRQGRTRFY